MSTLERYLSKIEERRRWPTKQEAFTLRVVKENNLKVVTYKALADHMFKGAECARRIIISLEDKGFCERMEKTDDYVYSRKFKFADWIFE